jgi:hypothetical protein
MTNVYYVLLQLCTVHFGITSWTTGNWGMSLMCCSIHTRRCNGWVQTQSFALPLYWTNLNLQHQQRQTVSRSKTDSSRRRLAVERNGPNSLKRKPEMFVCNINHCRNIKRRGQYRYVNMKRSRLVEKVRSFIPRPSTLSSVLTRVVIYLHLVTSVCLVMTELSCSSRKYTAWTWGRALFWDTVCLGWRKVQYSTVRPYPQSSHRLHSITVT